MEKIVETGKSMLGQLQPKLLEYQKRLDNYLTQYPICVEIEEKTKIPKVYLALGVAIILGLMVIFDIGAKFIVNLVGFVYPAYSCFKAIESPEKDDDVQWLTYWIINSFFQLIEYFSDLLLYWIPFYFVWKALFLVYLYAPQTKGAMVVYKSILRPFMLEAESTATKIANYTSKPASPTSPATKKGN